MKALKAHAIAWIVAAVLLLAGIGLFMWSQQDDTVRDRAFRAGTCGDHTCSSSTEFDDYYNAHYKNNYQAHLFASAACFCLAVAAAGYGTYLHYNSRGSKKSK